MEVAHLTEDETQALARAMLVEQRAQQESDAARLLLRWRDATDAKSALLLQLGTTYGFDATVPLHFDPQTGVLSTRNGSGG